MTDLAGYWPPPNRKRRRTNRDTFADTTVTVSTDGSLDALALPNASTYSRHTRAWCRTWCTAPQAQTFTVTDWQRLHMLAPLVDQFFTEPRKDMLAEIRLNESLLGATHVDRLRARITITHPNTDQEAAGVGRGRSASRAPGRATPPVAGWS